MHCLATRREYLTAIPDASRVHKDARMNRHHRRVAAKQSKPLSRSEAIRAVYNLLSVSTDPTVSGATLFLPDGESLYVDVADARAMNDNAAARQDAAFASGVQLAHDEASGVMRIYLMSSEDGRRMALAAAAGNAHCAALLRACVDCAQHVAHAAKDRPALCLCCPEPIRDMLGVTICLAVPDTDNPQRAVGGVICKRCAAGSDLSGRAASALRNLWPDLREIEVMPGPGTLQ